MGFSILSEKLGLFFNFSILFLFLALTNSLKCFDFNFHWYIKVECHEIYDPWRIVWDWYTISSSDLINILSVNYFFFLFRADIPTNQCSSITISVDEGKVNLVILKFCQVVNMCFLIKRCLVHTLMMYHRSPLQSAIGEGMTRKDHSDVSNQVCSCLFTV